jgi:rhombotail lipoprotein
MKTLPLRSIAALLAVVLLSACSLFDAATFREPRQAGSTSLVDYLYPGEQPPPASEPPQVKLRLPLRVGLAFVPEAPGGTFGLSDARKSALLDEVRTAFADRPFVEDIVVVPESYLRRGGGLKELQQLARLQGLDVMALVSYDQMIATDERPLALTYWTIVGAYIVPANTNTAETFIDIAVVDPATGRLIVRSPGRSSLKADSTLVAVKGSLRELASEGYTQAMRDMVANLDRELVALQERLKHDPRGMDVAYREGYGGAGALGPLLLSSLLAAVWAHRRRR